MTQAKQQENCLFCKIIQKKIPSKIVYEDEIVLAFEDVNPQAPVHLLIIPKVHIARLADIKAEDQGTLVHLFSIIPKLSSEKGILEKGFRTVINSGEGAGQTVFHLHVHLMGGRNFRWPPG